MPYINAMKRIVSLLTMSVWAVMVCAQDVIIKRDATRIEALILEVSDSEVRYKIFSDPYGPTFVVKTNDIATIIYKNGDVQVFEKKAESSTLNGNYVVGTMTCTGSNYYLNDKMMSKDEFRYLLMKNCMPAYNYYKKMSIMAYVGIALIPVGAAMVAAGQIIWDSDSGLKPDGLAEKRIALMSVGAVFSGAGIALCGVGFGCRNKACDIFNEKCANTAFNNKGIRLDLQTSKNGLGIALKF